MTIRLTEKFQTLRATILRESVEAIGDVAVMDCNIEGDLIALDAAPLFSHCMVTGDIRHPDPTRIVGCIAYAYTPEKRVEYPPAPTKPT